MTYKFGDYKVITDFLKDNLFYIPRWKMRVYYGHELIAWSDFHFKEAYALESASYEIAQHKRAIKSLQNV